MKIIELRAENFKRIEAIEIRPTSNLVQITGKNGGGKTSTLDCLWVAFAGKSACPVVPIRKGQERAKIRLDLGTIVVTRTFTLAEDGDYTTNIVVESGEGARYPSPQKLLDSLLGQLSFDPLAFARMGAREQFDALRRFVPDVDFVAIEAANRKDFDRRTELNRFAKQETAAASTISVPVDTPEEPIDESELLTQLQQAGETNTQLERRRSNRERALESIAKSREAAAHLDHHIGILTQTAEDVRDRAVKRIQAQITALQQQMESVRAECTDQIERDSEAARQDAAKALKEADALQAKIDAAGEIPPIIDTDAITQRINAARVINANVALLDKRMAHHKRAHALEEEAKQLTEQMEQREAGKRAAIAAASMPVDGVEFGDGIVLLNGVPFEQGSDAEQLRASVAIAMALNPKLKIVRVRDGSLLDENGLALLAQMAQLHDFQVWVEKVDSSGRIGFVLEDGHIVHRPNQEEPAATEQPQAATA